MLEYEQIIAALVKSNRALSDRSFAAHRISEQLARFDDHDVAAVLHEIYRGALRKQPGYLDLLEALSEFAVFSECFAGRLAEIFDIADNEGYIFAAEWLAPLPIRQKPVKGLYAHDDLQTLTLGERRWLARKATPGMIEKLLVDPDPAVIHNLLNHPRLTEPDVLRICSKTPNNPEVMRVVYRHPKWFARYPIKKAILNNPATSPRLVVLILVYLSLQDLRDLLRSARFSPGFIRTLIAERKAAGQNDDDVPEGEDSISDELDDANSGDSDLADNERNPRLH